MTTVTSKMLAQPNPFLSAITVEFTTERDDQGVMRLSDSHGKIVKMLFWKFKKGMNIARLSNLDQLANGNYMLEIVDIQGQVLHQAQLVKEL
jgi:hypothetical protein